MTIPILLSISIFTNSFSDLIKKVLMVKKDSNPIITMIIFQFSAGFLVFLYGLLIDKSDFSTLFKHKNIYIPLAMTISTTVYALGSLMTFKANKSISLSKFTIIFASRLFVTIIISSILFNEKLTIIQLIGSILLLISTLVVTVDSRKIFESVSKGEVFALIAAICFGISISLDSYVLRTVPIFPYLTVGYSVPGIFVLLANTKEIKSFKTYLNLSAFSKILLYSLLSAITGITYMKMLQISSNAPLISSLFQVSTVITVILGIILLKEYKNLTKKIVGIVICFVGLLLLI